MSTLGAIVVRRGERRATYRDPCVGEALILDQIASDPPPDATLLAAGGVPVLAASVCSITLPLPLTALVGVLALGVAAGAAGTTLARHWAPGARRRRASLVLAGGVLRVYREPDFDRVALALEAHTLARLEVVPRGLAPREGWAVVGLDERRTEHVLLETADHCAGLRVRTLLVERLARDGAFAALETISTKCPTCGERILMPQAWVPTRIACAACGEEGVLTRER